MHNIKQCDIVITVDKGGRQMKIRKEFGSLTYARAYQLKLLRKGINTDLHVAYSPLLGKDVYMIDKVGKEVRGLSDIVDRIRLYRLDTGMTLTELAEKCGVSYPTMQRICARKSKPNLITEGKIRKVVGNE